MMTFLRFREIGLAAALMVALLGRDVSAIGTSFSYQGELLQNGVPANGTFTMRFRLYDAASGGNQVGSTLTLFDKPVVNGRFTTSLGFGANAYASLNRWLEIEIEGTVLSPRQRLESVPHSIETRGMHVSPDESFVGIGRTDPVTPAEKFGVYAATTGFGGMFMETSLNGTPFYGYATAGTINAYHYFDSASNQWRLWAGADRLAIDRSTGFVGIGRTDPVTSAEKFGVYMDTNSFGGMYVETNDGGKPFYGYSTNGSVDAYHYYDSSSDQWRLSVGFDRVVVDRATGNVAIGQVSPTSRLAVHGDGDSTLSVVNPGGAGLGDAVYAQSSGSNSAAFFGVGNNGGSAGLFVGEVEVVGDVDVSGTLTKSAGSFKIDHPLDPEGKTLSHSFVESPDMMNIYNGNVLTDEAGYATVELPEYFEALNRDYRYQLTVIGTFARAIVAEEVHGGAFVIQTDEPNVKVSWQVTGIRDDAYARTHPIIVEEMKDESERGLFLSPEAFGYGEAHRIKRAERDSAPVEAVQGAEQ